MMATARMAQSQSMSRSRAIGYAWIAAAVIACLSALIVNGRPLFYWDTVGYIDQGIGALEKLHLVPKSPPSAQNAAPTQGTSEPPSASPSTSEAETTADHGAAAEPEKIAARPSERTVDGSRSIFYSVLAGSLAHVRALELLVLVHLGAVFLAAWLAVRVASRMAPPAVGSAAAVSIPLIAASFGSLSFFICYLMPDIFAPVMLIAIAALAAFLPAMLWWEVGVLVAVAAVALVSHLSHLAIGLLVIPVALILALFRTRGRWATLVVLLALVVGAGFAQQAVIRLVATRVAQSEVIVKPFITARLIQDKVGYRYLQAHCPDPGNECERMRSPWQAAAEPEF